MRVINKWLILIAALFSLMACGENHALKEETFRFDKANEGWIVEDSTMYRFIMQDDNGISYGFSLRDSSYYFGKSWSSILGVTTNISYKEYHYQNFYSSYGKSFHLSLTAGFPPYGDDIYVGLDDINFCYDFEYDTISRLDVFSKHKSMSMTDQGYEQQDGKIFSTVTFLNDVIIGDVTYDSVLHFELKDFTEELYHHSVREIFIAKGVGLVKYVLNSGLVVVRVAG
jgi:hypothetical protein